MNKVLIAGYGTTGKNIHQELRELTLDVYDPKYGGYVYVKDNNTYDFVFICVDTPYVSKENPCDLTAIKEVIKQWKPTLEKDGIFVIKSTVLPNSSRMLSKEFDVNIVYSPEYYGSTPHCNNFTFNFTILGGEKKHCIKVQQLLQQQYDATHTFRIVNYETAELAKYMENCFLATKVSFCTQFFDIANKINVDYEDLRELFILDPRISASHTFIDRNKPYWDSHCLNKDVKAIAEKYNAEFLSSMITFNEKHKKNQKIICFCD
ncbi:MAG: hypothetical protein IJ150_03710 [Bacteroidales bacterium]|nr:hypothetical protein [Bacteroidales bacterium]